MDKKLIGLAVVLILALLIFTVPKYFSVTGKTVLGVTGDIEKIEVYHFHMTRQCYSCKTLGAYAEETVNTYFSDELKSGRIVFGHINIEFPENKALAEKYQATGSSLFIGVHGNDDSFSKEEDSNVWYKIDNKEGFMNYLKGVIETKLSGE